MLKVASIEEVKKAYDAALREQVFHDCPITTGALAVIETAD